MVRSVSAIATVILAGPVVMRGPVALVGADPGEPNPREAKEFRIATLWARNDMVSSGDVLVGIDFAQIPSKAHGCPSARRELVTIMMMRGSMR